MNGFIGVDYGRRRIGLALADPMGLTTRGLETVAAGSSPEASAKRVAEASKKIAP